MIYRRTRLQTLYWEIKSRFCFIVFSFFLSFFVSYRNSLHLLFLFVSSYDIIEKTKYFLNCSTLKSAVFSDFILQNKITTLLSVAIGKRNEFTNADAMHFVQGNQQQGFHVIHPLMQNFALQGKVDNFPEAIHYFEKVANHPKGMIYLLESFDNYHKNSEKITTIPEVIDFFCKNDQLMSIFNEKDLIKFLNVLDVANISAIRFIFTDVDEAFSSSILVCLIFSFVFCFLHLIYTTLSFLVPSFYYNETKILINRATIFILLWFSFIVFLQNKIIPRLAEFLLKFQYQSVGFNIEAETKIFSYCVWASTIFLIANFIFFLFSLMIIVVISDKMQISFFTLHRKWCLLLLLLIAALIAPPEFFSQFFLAFILICCFELLIYFFFVIKKLKCFRQ